MFRGMCPSVPWRASAGPAAVLLSAARPSLGGDEYAGAAAWSAALSSYALVLVSMCNLAEGRDQWLDLLAAVAFFLLSQLSLMVFMKVFDCFFIHGTVEDALEKELPEAHWIHLPRNQVGLTLL